LLIYVLIHNAVSEFSCALTVADGFQQKASSGLGTDSTSSESGFGKNNAFMSSAELGSSTGMSL